MTSAPVVCALRSRLAPLLCIRLASLLRPGPRLIPACQAWRLPYEGFDAPTYQRRGIRIRELDAAA